MYRTDWCGLCNNNKIQKFILIMYHSFTFSLGGGGGGGGGGGHAPRPP